MHCYVKLPSMEIHGRFFDKMSRQKLKYPLLIRVLSLVDGISTGVGALLVPGSSYCPDDSCNSQRETNAQMAFSKLVDLGTYTNSMHSYAWESSQSQRGGLGAHGF